MIGVVPVQVPLVLVSVWPWRAIPESTGQAVFAGAATVTVALSALRWEAEPAAFVAVTSEYTLEPTSAAVRT